MLGVRSLLVAMFAVLLTFGVSSSKPAWAATAPVGLGTAAGYSVLGGQTVTNTGPTTLVQGLGVSPGSAFTGFPPGLAAVTHAADAQALLAQTDLTLAYINAASRAPTGAVAGDIVGRTFTDGVYAASSSLFISGTVTLDGQGDPNSVWIFQTGSTLITASASRINLINGALPCHVFWQVGSSATLGTGSSFVGTIMALTSITVTTGVTVQGRALARNGSTTLDTDTFIAPGCQAPVPPPVTTAATVPPTVPTLPPVITVPGATVPSIPVTPPATVVGGGTVPTVPPGCNCVTSILPNGSVVTIPIVPGASVPGATIGPGGSLTTIGSNTTECFCVDTSTVTATLASPTSLVPCPPGTTTKHKSSTAGAFVVGSAFGGAACGVGAIFVKYFRRRL